MAVKVRSWPLGQSFYTLRGIALHQVMAHLLEAEDWQALGQLKLRTFTLLASAAVAETSCQVTRAFFTEHPAQLTWVAGCLRILLKCLRDWQASGPMLVEPTLPILTLPCGRKLRCGQPDFHVYAEAFGGRVNIEMKSGWKRIKRHAGKLARYNGGTPVLLAEQGAPEPFRGTIWLSFSDCVRESPSNWYVARPNPVLNYHFEPYDPARINKVLTARFGVGVDDLHHLPRSYIYVEDLCA